MADTPDLSNYYMIHEAMRRGADQLASAMADLDPGDTARIRALRWYCSGLLGELHTHHTLEDEVFFPALSARVPTFAHYEASLAADHVHLGEVMEGLDRAVDGLVRAGDGDLDRHLALEHSTELARFLHEHLGVEDSDVLPMFARHFSAAEYDELDEQAIKHTGLRQLLFTVPWAVSLAGAEEVDHVLTDGPFILRAVWHATHRRYARRAELALGTKTPVVLR
jgi:hypothetical protein